MATHELIDAQFDRAVEIVQGLPKTGPIQTDYEEKLTMYSLYKQATVGNVKPPRPGMWDMLGRAKWDAWAKHRDLDPYEAKWLYVDALIKVLRKYSDKTVAKSLIEELESYGGDVSNIVRSQTFSHAPGSDSSSSTASDDDGPQYHSQVSQIRHIPGDTKSEDEEFDADEPTELPVLQHEQAAVQSTRPPSSLSSHRYRTPLTQSLAMSPPLPQGLPATQPLPNFETPSAFAEPTPASSPSYPATSSYAGISSESSRTRMATPSHLYPAHTSYRVPLPQQPRDYPIRPASRLTLERAVENVQVHLTALTERLESLETLAAISRSHMSAGSSVASPGRGLGSPNGRRDPVWDLEDLGMWSILLNPVSRALEKFRDLATFFARNENRTPTVIVVRRLCLDASFLAFILVAIKVLWKKSGVRRREVRAALIILWRAIVGGKPERILIDRGIQS